MHNYGRWQRPVTLCLCGEELWRTSQEDRKAASILHQEKENSLFSSFLMCSFTTRVMKWVDNEVARDSHHGVWRNFWICALKHTNGSTQVYTLSDTHVPISHTPIAHSLSVLRITPCQALKLDLLVAWWLQPGFQSTEVTLPRPPTPLFPFILSLNELFFPPSISGLLTTGGCVQEGETHTLLIPGRGQSSLKVNTEDVSGIPSLLFVANRFLRFFVSQWLLSNTECKDLY